MQERDIFIEALQIDDPAQRATYLATACGTDAALKGRVEGLLIAHERQESFFLDVPAGGSSGDSPTIERATQQPLGTQIGPYKLLQVIGEGGMGVVYMAEQRQPVERKVALKIIKQGMDSRQVIARFEAERQALALMDHPNIAKVLDAGTVGVPALAGALPTGEDRLKAELQQGRPYFVMELVKGQPITKYCDEKHLSLKERLELMIPVCQAIQHAHQKGIIHRDIKPANVLVAQYDGRPVPKVIDFGVAKATAQKLTERTMFTEFGQIIGTLEYMSPEQAELNQLDIDTRSDIYSLGVLLYELLTGSTPFDKQSLKTAGFHEMLRIIREEEPPKPSTKLSTIETLPSVAANRSVEPNRLSKSLRGELDWIVMKALDKDRSRRYETASGLAADVERFLRDEPVLASPPSPVYRFRKFARRNKVALVTAAAVAISLLAGIAVSAWQAVRAQQALRQATAENRRATTAENEVAQRYKVAKEAVETYLLRVEGDERLKGPGFTDLRKRLLEAAVPFLERLSQWEAQGPAAEVSKAEAFWKLAGLRQELGEYDLSLPHWEESQRILRQLLAAAPTDRAYREKLAHVLVGTAAHHRLRNEHSEQILSLEQEALEIRQQLAKERPEVPGALHELAMSLNNVALAGADAAKSKEQLKAAIKIWEGLAERFPKGAGYREELVRASHNLGRMYEQLTAALAVHERGLAISEQMAKESPESARAQVIWANSHFHLANAYVRDPDQLAKALEHRRQAVQILQEFVRAHPQCPPSTKGMLASFHSDLGILYKQMEQPDQAEVAYRDNLRICAELAADFPLLVHAQVTLAGAESNLGALLSQQTKHNEGIDLLNSAKQRLEKVQDQTGGDDRAGKFWAITLENLAWAYHQRWAQVDDEGASLKYLLLARELQQQLVDLYPANDDYAVALGGKLVDLGTHYFSSQRPNDALASFTQAIGALEEVVERRPAPPASPPTARRFLRNAYKGRSSTQVKLEAFGKAYDDIRRAIELDDESLPDYQPQQIAIQSQLDPAAAAQSIEGLIASGPAGEKHSLGARLYELVVLNTRDPDQSRKYQRRVIELVQLADAAGYYNTPKGLAELDSMELPELGEEFDRLKTKIKSTAKPQP